MDALCIIGVKQLLAVIIEFIQTNSPRNKWISQSGKGTKFDPYGLNLQIFYDYYTIFYVFHTAHEY